ncbi:hypothetical protein ACES2L_13090 [Bdellovibrio bacteriovorus]
MKKTILMLATTLLTANAFATSYHFKKITYKGTTQKGAECSVVFDLANNNISFSFERDGFGFSVDPLDIQDAFAQNVSPIVLKGNDGPVSARLAITREEGKTVRASYTSKAFLNTKRVLCSNLVKVEQ